MTMYFNEDCWPHFLLRRSLWGPLPLSYLRAPFVRNHFRPPIGSAGIEGSGGFERENVSPSLLLFLHPSLSPAPSLLLSSYIPTHNPDYLDEIQRINPSHPTLWQISWPTLPSTEVCRLSVCVCVLRGKLFKPSLSPLTPDRKSVV